MGSGAYHLHVLHAALKGRVVVVMPQRRRRLVRYRGEIRGDAGGGYVEGAAGERERVTDRARLRDRVRVRGRLDVEDIVREAAQRGDALLEGGLDREQRPWP